MNHCSKCNLPETYETIEFDQKNVCNVCKGAEYKQTKIILINIVKILTFCDGWTEILH